MPVAFVDCEVYCEADSKKVGFHRYAAHPSKEILCWSICAPGWPRARVFAEGDLYEILLHLREQGALQWSAERPLVLYHWSAFDRMMMGVSAVEAPGVIGYPDIHDLIWRDLSAWSLLYGAPGGLDEAASWWGTPGKLKSGKRLINRFCKPQKDGSRIRPGNDLDGWRQFIEYARQDTPPMVAIWRRMRGLDGGRIFARNWPYLAMIDRMNTRGIPVDREAAERALARILPEEQRLSELCLARLGFRPSQTERVRAYLGTEDVQKKTLTEFLRATRGDRTPAVRRQRWVARVRLETSGAARKKLVPLLRMSDKDDPRIRGAFVYHGPWTRRLASRGLQAQNFVRAAIEPGFFEALERGDEIPKVFEAVRRNIRGFLRTPAGRAFVAADYSAIELNMGAWLGDERWLVDLLHEGGDPYRVTAGEILGIPADQIGKKDPARDFGKVVELGSLYQLGGRGLRRQCAARGITISKAEAKRAIAVYRATHPAIVQAWAECEEAFEELVDGPPGAAIRVLGGRARLERDALCIRAVRPSGFAQYYWLPRIGEGEWPDGGPKRTLEFTGRGKTGGMMIRETWGGRIYQGIVQGSAADLMLDAMRRIERQGAYPVMSVHDEIVIELAESAGGRALKRLCEEICKPVHWAPGLPLRAEGWFGARYTKA